MSKRKVTVSTRPATELPKKYTGVRWSEDACTFEVWINGKKVRAVTSMKRATEIVNELR